MIGLRRIALALLQADSQMNGWGYDVDSLYAQFSRDGQRIVTVSDDYTARLWEAQSGELVTTINQRPKNAHVARLRSGTIEPALRNAGVAKARASLRLASGDHA